MVLSPIMCYLIVVLSVLKYCKTINPKKDSIKFVSMAMKIAMRGEFPNFTFDYSKLKIANRSLYSSSFVIFDSISDKFFENHLGG